MKPWIDAGSAWIILFVNLSPVLAQFQRYPTETELQQLLQEFRQSISELEETGIYSDSRTLGEREAREMLVDNWTELDPAIAPFLGDWTAIEESLYIYPAATRGNVCILDVYLDIGDFYMGEVRDGKVYTTTHQVFFLDSGLLNTTVVTDEQPSSYPYGNPRPLSNSLNQLKQSYPDMIAAFHEADCLTELPDVTHAAN